MVLIISEINDISTSKVISWLNYYGIKWLRINAKECFIENIYCKIENRKTEYYFKKGDKKINLSEIKSLWYRRVPKTLYRTNEIDLNNKVLKDLNEKIVQTLIQKESILFPIPFLLMKTSGLYCLGNPFLISINKLQQLLIARSVGLKIPRSIVTSDKEELIKFKNKVGSLITKPLSEVTSFKIKNSLYSTYTELVDDDIIEWLDDSFLATYFQEKIEKEFEIRVFYLDGTFHNMAMFTQDNKQTSIDFRHYNNIKPTRSVPFMLPRTIEKRIRDFMNCLNLNTGSLDFIYSINREYIFLEVNPIGQFDMVSVPCNYYLERLIAKKFMNDEETKNY